jgi:hypothetical protein
MRRWTARLLFTAALVVATGVAAGAAGSQALGKCPDVVGPAWTYKAGTGKNDGTYRGTHYTLSVVRISCSAATPLVRKVAVVKWSGNGQKLLPGYGCGAGVMRGARLVAGQCVTATAAGPTRNPKSFSWTPDIQDPTSKRVG